MEAAALHFDNRKQRRGEGERYAEGKARIADAVFGNFFLPIFKRAFSCKFMCGCVFGLVNDAVFARADGFIGEDKNAVVPADFRCANNRLIRL